MQIIIRNSLYRYCDEFMHIEALNTQIDLDITVADGAANVID